MGRAHVLDSSGQDSKVVFHIAVPGTGNNSAGTQWRVALKNSGIGGIVSMLPSGNGSGGTIDATEQAQITNGEVFEIVRSVPIPPGMNSTQANAFLDALHADLTTEIQTQLQARLMYFGYVRT